MTHCEKQLRVLYSFSDRLGLAGIGLLAWHQITALLDEGVRVWVYCPSCEKPLQGAENVTETMKFGHWRLPLRRIGPCRPRVLHDKRVARALRRLAGRIDLVHCWPGASLDTLRTARQLGITSFLERPNSHTQFAFEVVAREHEKLGVPLRRRHSHTFDAKRLEQEEAEYALADCLLCPSEFVVATFMDRGFGDEQIALHQYGYDPAQLASSAVHDVNHRNRGLKAAFVGSCEPRKGLHYALEAWLSSGAEKEGRFFICGRFVPGYRKVLRDLLRHPSVIECGYLEDVSSILRSCDILVLPSIEEGSALVTYEARACGCVLLVSEATGARCQHMENGLVHRVGDVDVLRAQISLLASEPAHLERLRTASLRGLHELTWKSAVRLLVSVYLERLGRRSPSRRARYVSSDGSSCKEYPDGTDT